jgi:hypothetical protein
MMDGFDEPGHDESHYFNIHEDWGMTIMTQKNCQTTGQYSRATALLAFH